MSKSVLIIEDDESVRKIVAELCQSMGLTAEGVGNGRQGLEAFQAARRDLVIIDLLLPGMDGAKVAEQIRESAGDRVALLAVTGVFKDAKVAKEMREKYKAELLLKPFRLEELRSAIARGLGMDLAAPPPASAPAPQSSAQAMSGPLSAKPFIQLLIELYRGKATGLLELSRAQQKKRIYLNRGFVRYAVSNVREESIGGMQVAEGSLSPQALESAMARAKVASTPLHAALQELKLMGPAEIQKALKRQTEEVVITAFGWNDGELKFVPQDTENAPNQHSHPASLLCAAARRYVSAEQARTFLAARPQAMLSRTPELDRDLYAVRSAFPGETLTPMVNGRIPLSEVLRRCRPDDLLLLYALAASGLATGAAPASGSAAPGAAPGASGAALSPAGRPFTPQEEEARRLIEAEHQRLSGVEDLHALLGLPPKAPLSEVKGSYLRLAKRWHADSFAGLELGDAREKLSQLFARLSEAHAVLVDDRKRADYEALRERRAQGLPTDIEVIFKAEQAFSRGEALLGQGRVADAEAAFREAVRLDPSRAPYCARLGQALFRAKGLPAAAEAKKHLEQALKISGSLAMAKVFLAQILAAEGDRRGADRLLQEVLLEDPHDVDAARERGRLEEQQSQVKEAPGGKGLLGKFFKGR